MSRINQLIIQKELDPSSVEEGQVIFWNSDGKAMISEKDYNDYIKPEFEDSEIWVVYADGMMVNKENEYNNFESSSIKYPFIKKNQNTPHVENVEELPNYLNFFKKFSSHVAKPIIKIMYVD